MLDLHASHLKVKSPVRPDFLHVSFQACHMVTKFTEMGPGYEAPVVQGPTTLLQLLHSQTLRKVHYKSSEQMFPSITS